MIDVLVTGQSLPAMQAALDLAEVGLRVVVIGAGGCLDADSSEASVVLPPPLLRGAAGGWLPQAVPVLHGIPGFPLAADTIALLGAAAATRAYLDRVIPHLEIGKTRWLGEMVRRRMGAAVLERLVDPQVFDRFGVRAAQLEVAIAAPGLSEALSRYGSLSSAVLADAGRQVQGGRNGVPLADAGVSSARLAATRKLERYGVQLLDRTVTGVTRAGKGWRIELDRAERIEARALVLDHPDDPTMNPPFDAQHWWLLPDMARVRASVAIAPVERVPSGQQALTLGEGWSVRLYGTPGRALLSSARLPVTQCCAPDVAELRRVLSLAGAEAAPGARWQCAVVSAPYVTRAERATAQSRFDTVTGACPELLPVGSVLHENDLGSALAHAHTEAVRLRRRLLGIEHSDSSVERAEAGGTR